MKGENPYVPSRQRWCEMNMGPLPHFIFETWRKHVNAHIDEILSFCRSPLTATHTNTLLEHPSTSWSSLKSSLPAWEGGLAWPGEGGLTLFSALPTKDRRCSSLHRRRLPCRWGRHCRSTHANTQRVGVERSGHRGAY